MGKIHQDVKKRLLAKEPQLEAILTPFLTDFDVDWGNKQKKYNTTFYEFMIKPEKSFAEAFGLEYHLLLIYTPYDEMQPRAMQAISAAFLDRSIKGRVENFICIVISKDANAKKWINKYSIEHQDLRTYVVFNYEMLVSKKHHNLRTFFREQFSERDLFDVQLPLLDDLYFFGRQSTLRDIQDNIRRCENCGIFGLRKTGKTSLLYKIKRTIDELNLGHCLFYDAKNVKIRMRSWTGLLSLISEDICKTYGISIPQMDADNKLDVAETFEAIVRQIPVQNKLILFFDEIEFISFEPPHNLHWKEDYFDFWQLLWTLQSENRNFCFIIAGVNPKVVETSSINRAQNPLFSIVKKYYIQGLSREDIYSMSHRIGRRMSLSFDNTAIDYLYSRYGGHPLLTRLALSYENQHATKKPATFSEVKLVNSQAQREEILVPYCQHIIDVLNDFYTDEYTLLQYLSIDDIQDFLDLATSPFAVLHLKNYGLLTYERNTPKIGLPVVASYIRQRISSEQKTRFARTIIPVSERDAWIRSMTKAIINYIRQLEVAIKASNLPLLFGSNSFPEADKLLDIPVVKSENDFKAFISTFSNCFVESIENYGKSIQKADYFWKDIQNEYADLFNSLLRIKAYRNWSEHLSLNQKMQEIVDRYLMKDLEEKKIYDVEEPYFVLQQCTIEKMKLSISLEITRLS